MNPNKVEEGLFHHHLDPIEQPQPLILDHHNPDEHPPPPPLLEFCLPPLSSEFDLFRDDDDEDSVSRTSSTHTNDDVSSPKTNPRPQFINPNPHISSQFYTFNIESHCLMIRCILDHRLPTPDEIRAATPPPLLASWKSVWKDRNEDTAYLTAWKRIQDKLTVHNGQHGHQPGPLDGNARIMHRVVGHKGGFLTDQDFVYGTDEEVDDENFEGNNDGDVQRSVLQQVKELKHEVRLLERKVSKIPPELLSSVSHELFDLLNKVRNVGEYGSKSGGFLLENELELVDWNSGRNTDLMEDDDDSFEPTLGDVGSWDKINGDCRNQKNLDEKTILDCEESKLTKPVTNDETEADALVGLQVDNFYPENPKWYDPPCGLDPGMDCGSNGFRHGEIV